ncbi:hypothetical protein VB711_19475 [Cronbergia sp. UHCC 0137]|nr:hypothetical protein [Cronbergia sp. UHCC 0137]MEA5620008.1 hypothetical protein [Cronbergia sp. UHCC 0137]
MSTAEKNRRDRARGKPKKLAITACVHKMLIILNAMIRDHLPWSMTHDSQPISA